MRWLRLSFASPHHKPSSLGEVDRGNGEPDGDSERGELVHPACRLEAVRDGCGHRNLAENEPECLDLAEVRQADEDEHEAHQRQQRSDRLDHGADVIVLTHCFSPFGGAVLGGTLPPRSAGFWNSDDATNIASIALESQAHAIEKAPILGFL